MSREPGYYWCKYNGEWIIARWYEYMTNAFEWDVFDKIMCDSDFEEIDERRIERNGSVNGDDDLRKSFNKKYGTKYGR